MVTIGALAAVTAPAASAAEACANEAVRVQQSATHLPNCMAYERATPADKNGAPPRPFAVAPDGSAMLFYLNSALEGSLSFVASPNLVRRSADGTPDWALSPLAPPLVKRLPGLLDEANILATSTSFDRVIMSTRHPVADNDQGGITGPVFAQSLDLYMREPDGSFTWLVPDPSVVDESLEPVDTLGGSPDLSRVVLATTRSFDPQVTTTDVNHVYVWSRTGTQLATVLPDDSVPTGLLPNAVGSPSKNQQPSADARRIAFVNDDGSGPRVYVRFDADDPAKAATREVAVGPNGEACTDAALTGLSRDGHRLIFSCREPGGAGGAQTVLYLRDLDGGPEAVRRLGPAGDFGATLIQATDDFSRAYLVGGDTLYAVRDGGPMTAVLAARADPSSSEQPFRSLSMSPDGEHLAFLSARDYELSDVDAGPAATKQAYRYTAATDTLTCVSCRQDGAPTEGAGDFQGGVRAISTLEPLSTVVGDNGTVAFSTTTALDGADTNGVQDAYAWIGGRQVLLTSGRSEYAAASAGISRDGRSVFFTTAESLARNDRDRGAYDIYAAREGGGFLIPDDPAPCAANCQGTGPERPGLPATGSVGVIGGGNLAATPRKATPRTTASLTASKSVRGSSTTVRVTVSRAGKIRLSGSGLRTVTVRASKAGMYRVTARLSKSGLKRQARKGRLATRVTARFTSEAGASVRAQRSITFTVAKRKGGR